MRVLLWAASWGPVDTRWHVVGRSSGGSLPSLCGAYVYGPLFLRRVWCPQGMADRAVCPVCALRAGVEVPRPAGLFTWGDFCTSETEGIVASGVLPDRGRLRSPSGGAEPVPVVWPTEDPDAPRRGGGRHRLRRVPSCRWLRQAAA